MLALIPRIVDRQNRRFVILDDMFRSKTTILLHGSKRIANVFSTKEGLILASGGKYFTTNWLPQEKPKSQNFVSSTIVSLKDGILYEDYPTKRQITNSDQYVIKHCVFYRLDGSYYIVYIDHNHHLWVFDEENVDTGKHANDVTMRGDREFFYLWNQVVYDSVGGAVLKGVVRISKGLSYILKTDGDLYRYRHDVFTPVGIKISLHKHIMIGEIAGDRFIFPILVS